jgi:hypothetical protein
MVILSLNYDIIYDTDSTIFGILVVVIYFFVNCYFFLSL